MLSKLVRHYNQYGMDIYTEDKEPVAQLLVYDKPMGGNTL